MNKIEKRVINTLKILFFKSKLDENVSGKYNQA